MRDDILHRVNIYSLKLNKNILFPNNYYQKFINCTKRFKWYLLLMLGLYYLLYNKYSIYMITILQQKVNLSRYELDLFPMGTN